MTLVEGGEALALWLQRLMLRSPLSQQDQDIVRSFPGVIRKVDGTRDIVRLGERTSHVSLVVDGVVARFGQTADGNRQFTAFFIRGDMADLHAAVMPVVSSPLQSTCPTVLFQIDRQVIRTAAAQSPSLAKAFWCDCVTESQIGAEWLVSIGRGSALSRIAHLLCEFACRYGVMSGERDRFPLLLTQAHIGDAVGLTAVHVNRTIRALRESGSVIAEAGQVTIRDWDLLRRQGGFDPGYLHLNDTDPRAGLHVELELQ
ncbi:Crp/Fnr family transcriptional regulator [Sphingomonas sp. BK235]|uniref:Crp/Fnr family transcriptional regulator n=1 Tax=Sphingomonas sp. BK235 TaxID=2512131 RepID=UPI00104A14E1|nr:Crp/Fnr family transcriptional regulator [Sphingomonas sp. BK235]TCP29345.1 CRP-like cAMP-binding protein [Sphingomonas sp. BK235]